MKSKIGIAAAAFLFITGTAMAQDVTEPDQPKPLAVYLEMTWPPLPSFTGSGLYDQKMRDLIAYQRFQYARMLTKLSAADFQITDSPTSAQYKLTINMPARQYVQAQWMLQNADEKRFVDGDQFYPTDKEELVRALLGMIKAVRKHAGIQTRSTDIPAGPKVIKGVTL
jgi:hypothetical protein